MCEYLSLFLFIVRRKAILEPNFSAEKYFLNLFISVQRVSVGWFIRFPSWPNRMTEKVKQVPQNSLQIS